MSRQPQNAEKDKGRIDTTVNAGLAGGTAEVVQRYGEANKQHFAAYGGIDRESGQEMAKSLKSIHKGKIHPDYRDTNINQQAGFAAEVKTVTRENAEKVIQGDTQAKAVRTDDMLEKKQPDGKGNTIGEPNDQLYDIAEIDANGIYVEGTARQLKFVGGTPRQCANKLLQRNYDKYRDTETPIEIPADFFDDVKKELSDKAEDLKRQIEAAEKSENSSLAANKKAQLERVEKTNESLKKGKLTKQEAIEARLYPKLSTAKDVARISNRAGLQAAKSSVIIGGGISFIRNSVSVIKGDSDPKEAAVEFAKDTAGAGALGYATGFIGAALKGGMQNAPSQYIRSLSRSSLPGIVVTVTLETGKVMKRYADGEIDGTECLQELGERGTGMLASAMGAAVGAIAIPIPIVGGLIGGMIGYSLATSYYNELFTALKEAEIAHEERLRIEAECKEAIIAIKEYSLEMELVINNYLREHRKAFKEAFADMERAYETQDADEFIAGANRITRRLGGEPLFESRREFDTLMNNPNIINL